MTAIVKAMEDAKQTLIEFKQRIESEAKMHIEFCRFMDVGQKKGLFSTTELQGRNLIAVGFRCGRKSLIDATLITMPEEGK